MSATVMWRPIRAGKDVGKGPLRTILEKAYGTWPLRLGEPDAERLRMLGRVQGGDIQNELNELAGAVEKHGEIEVWAEY